MVISDLHLMAICFREKHLEIHEGWYMSFLDSAVEILYFANFLRSVYLDDLISLEVGFSKQRFAC